MGHVFVSGNMNNALRLVAESKEQKIRVDHKTMLIKVMAALGESSPPSIYEIECGSGAFKVCINLHLVDGKEIKNAVIEGLPFMEKEAAENSALVMAFRHLEEKWKVKVLDFSSRVAMSTSVFNTYSNIKEALQCVVGAFEKIDSTFFKCKDLANQLESISLNNGDPEYSLSVQGQICIGIIDFVRSVVKEYSENSSNFSSKISTLQLHSIKYHETMLDKRASLAGQCFMKKVVLPSKVLLDYVLLYLGLEKAKYSNGPHSSGMIEAVVKVRFPYMKNHKYCGKLKIVAKGSTSVNAEENAAFEALLFIQDNYKITVVDLNFVDRVNAENEEMMLRSNLGQILELGDRVKQMIEKYVKELSVKDEQISHEHVFLFGSTYAEDQNQTCKFIVGVLSMLVSDSDMCIRSCWEHFQRMEELSWELKQLELKV